MEKKPGFILFTYSHQITLHLGKIPLRPLKSYSTLSFSSQQKCSNPFIRLSLAYPCLSLTGLPALQTILQVWPHLQCYTEGKDHLLDSLTMILLTQLRILLTFFATGVCLACIHPGACQVLSAKLLPSHSVPSKYWCLFLPRSTGLCTPS